MTDLKQAAQQALEALEWNYNTDLDNIPACEQWAKMLNETITALKQALAEPDSDYERGFVDGMNLQTKGSVDKAVNRMTQTTHWEGCEAVHPECRTTPRKPLTDDEIAQAMFRAHAIVTGPTQFRFAREIERAHGIGEQT